MVLILNYEQIIYNKMRDKISKKMQILHNDFIEPGYNNKQICTYLIYGNFFINRKHFFQNMNKTFLNITLF